MRELELVRAELRRCKSWRSSTLRRVAGLEKEVSASRTRGDSSVYWWYQQLEDAECAAALVAKDLASAQRVAKMMGA
jgi:hypothetical protein